MTGTGQVSCLNIIRRAVLLFQLGSFSPRHSKVHVAEPALSVRGLLVRARPPLAPTESPSLGTPKATVVVLPHALLSLFLSFCSPSLFPFNARSFFLLCSTFLFILPSVKVVLGIDFRVFQRVWFFLLDLGRFLPFSSFDVCWYFAFSSVDIATPGSPHFVCRCSALTVH